MHIRSFQEPDHDPVILLWQRCGLIHPTNDPVKDIRRKLKVRADLFLVGELGDEIIASVMAGYEGHRGWLNYLAVAPERRNLGHGRQIVQHAERLLREAGYPKINLQVRTSNPDAVEFYRRLGYRVDEVVSLGKRLEVDDRADGAGWQTGPC